MNKWLVWGIAAACAYAAISYLAHRSAFFPARYPEGWWHRQTLLNVQDVSLTTADGVKLHGWWGQVADAPVVTLFLHGNAGNVTHRVAAIQAIRQAGSSLLLIDYRGYGKSEGRPTESGLYQDARAAYQWLLDRGYSPRQIIIHGESLGTAVAVDLAASNPIGGLVLEAPFSSVRAVAARVVPVLGPLFIWGFDSKAKIHRVQAPALFIHGSDDEIIDIALGEELFAAANQPKRFFKIPGAHHNDIPQVAGSTYREQLRAFYKEVANSCK